MISPGRRGGEIGVVDDQAGYPTNVHELSEWIINILEHDKFQVSPFKSEELHLSAEDSCS